MLSFLSVVSCLPWGAVVVERLKSLPRPPFSPPEEQKKEPPPRRFFFCIIVKCPHKDFCIRRRGYSRRDVVFHILEKEYFFLVVL